MDDGFAGVSISNFVTGARDREAEPCSEDDQVLAKGLGSHVLRSGKTECAKVEERSADRGVSKSECFWSVEEALEAEAMIQRNDKRPEPKYKIFYGQIMGSKDGFMFGSSEKMLHSSACSDVVIKIKFSGCSTLDDVKLTIKRDCLQAESRFEKLLLYFPLDVDFKKGEAEWDHTKQLMTVRLPNMAFQTMHRGQK